MMKKYFWLKLKNDFFDREEIKLIEAMPNGKDYIIFYMKLLLKSIENNGELFFRNTIPYSAEMLANVTNTNIDTVKVSVDIFLKFELMEKWDDGTLFMVETQNMIGSESKWASYKRIERQKKTEIGHCQKMSKKIPIELDIELEKNIESSLSFLPANEIERIDFKSFKKKLLNSFPSYEFNSTFAHRFQ
jgi:predicted phage replisome organizer